jgi:hypothetical protein
MPSQDKSSFKALCCLISEQLQKELGLVQDFDIFILILFLVYELVTYMYWFVDIIVQTATR